MSLIEDKAMNWRSKCWHGTRVDNMCGMLSHYNDA